MAAIDVVNRVLREFKRYTGDGLANEPTGAPLPVGDPQSGPWNPRKSDLREALLAPLTEVEGVVAEAAAEADRAEAAAVGIEGGLTPETVTASAYTPVLADRNTKLKRLSDPDGVTLTIPTNAAVAYSIGDSLNFEQAGAGQVTVAGDTGVTVRLPSGQVAVSSGQYSVFQALKIATDEWLLFGDLEQSRDGLLLGSRQIFSVAGSFTWTKPEGCVAVLVKLVGGGGGGRGAAAANGAAGGGAGGYSEKFITTGLGATEDVEVGAAGSAGTVGGNGTAGGSTSFGSHCSATGGGGGSNAGGTGGVGSGGDINTRGSSAASRSDDANDYSTPGGDSAFSGGGQAGFGAAGAGTDGLAGSGGGAGRDGAVGGAGGPGMVIVEEYY